MPSSPYGWAHSCCSAAALAAAIADPSVLHIESDIVVSSRTGLPVMAHPPSTDSDLSFEEFLVSCTTEKSSGGTYKDLKFDFKDMAAVEPCLQRTVKERKRLRSTGQTVWLNADVLMGPGCGPRAVEPGHRTPPAITANKFLQLCRDIYPEGILSLGWKVDVCGTSGYSDAHCGEMYDLLSRNDLLNSPLVLAVAARQLAKNPAPIQRLLQKLPQSELLVWTGTGEPPILPSLVERIRDAFSQANTNDEQARTGLRVKFDVAVQTGRLRGLVWNGDRSVALFRMYRPIKWALAEAGIYKSALLFMLACGIIFGASNQKT